MTRHYLRPTGFIDSPFGHDGSVARLTGGLNWFSQVEVIGPERSELVPVTAIEGRLDELGDQARVDWGRLTEARKPLVLGARNVRLDQPQIIGIVNATPDSFSDGGRFSGNDSAVEAGFVMSAEGAAIIDVGGESTRPGAKPVWEEDEADRVLPIIEQLAASGAAISADTRKSSVMARALAKGATMINDVSALTWDERSAKVVADSGCAVVLMHHQGAPEVMQNNPSYARPVLLEIFDWLEARIEAAETAGIARDRIVVDPGFGFGKTVQHNLQIMNGLALLHGLGCAILLGASRKRTIGALDNEAPAERRLGGSIAMALKAAEQGVQLLRVHDVRETVQAIKVWRGFRDCALTPA